MFQQLKITTYCIPSILHSNRQESSAQRRRYYPLYFLLSFFALPPPPPSLCLHSASISPPIPLFLALAVFHLEDMV